MITSIFLYLSLFITAIIFISSRYGIALVFAAHILIPRIVRIDVGSYDMSMQTFLVVMLFANFLLKGHYRNRNKFTADIAIATVAFCIVSFILIFFTDRAIGVSLNMSISSLSQFIVTNILFGLVVLYSLNDRKGIKIFINTALISFTLAGLYGIFNYVTSSNPYVEIVSFVYGLEDNVAGLNFLEESRGILEGRVMSTATHPLMWGQMLCVFQVFLILIRKDISEKTFIALTILSTVNVFLSGSRIAIFIQAIILFYLFISFSRKIKVGIVIGGITLFAFLSLGPLNRQASLFFDTLEATLFFWDEDNYKVNISGSTVDSRFIQLERSFEKIENNYFLGLGRGYISYELEHKAKDYKMLGYESIVFYKLVEEGIIGLIIFFLFFAILRKSLLKKTLDNKDSSRGINLYIGTYTVAIILTGMQASFFLFFLLLVIIDKYDEYLSEKQIQSNTLK